MSDSQMLFITAQFWLAAMLFFSNGLLEASLCFALYLLHIYMAWKS